MKKKVARTIEDYKDIIHLPRHESERRAKMPVADRAAQFAPFSAVVGQNEAVKEAARYTDQMKELDELEKVVVDEQLRIIESRLEEMPEISMVYFEADPAKDGGQYVTKVGRVKKLDTYKKEVVFTDAFRVSVELIYSIEV